jgi:hypothetical protein
MWEVKVGPVVHSRKSFQKNNKCMKSNSKICITRGERGRLKESSRIRQLKTPGGPRKHNSWGSCPYTCPWTTNRECCRSLNTALSWNSVRWPICRSANNPSETTLSASEIEHSIEAPESVKLTRCKLTVVVAAVRLEDRPLVRWCFSIGRVSAVSLDAQHCTLELWTRWVFTAYL